MNGELAERRPFGFALPRGDAWPWLMTGVVVVVSALILLLPALLLWLSFREAHPIEPVSAYSLLNYAKVFGDSFLYEVLANTLGFSIVTLVVAFVFGLPIAWLVVRTDLPGKPLVYTLM